MLWLFDVSEKVAPVWPRVDPSVAYFSDRFRRKSILLMSLAGSVVFMAAMGMATSFTQLILSLRSTGVIRDLGAERGSGLQNDMCYLLC